ncbi:MAG: DUF1043 family protein [Spongiibacteraceae bacterium]|nr:DUF1043 family protein [Spongiibacteraceae bacterium]
MYTLETLITLVVVALVIGLVAGAIIAQRRAPSLQSQQEMEKHVEELQQQQKDYQQDVTEHFSQTGQLLSQLTNSYQDVHNHLANGALKLADHKVGESISILTDKQDEQTPPNKKNNIMPPLDYAPKSSPHEKGMLNEKFGLAKVKPSKVSETDSSPTTAHE